MSVADHRTHNAEARMFVVAGRVQGVGFRPFVYRLAARLKLAGWVRNEAGRVCIHVEGAPEALRAFERSLSTEAPPLARPRLEGARCVEPAGCADFAIRASGAPEGADIHLPPDLFVCDDCLAEMNDPGARRHDYPFINCTQCGPRYTIITALPYDRPATSMAGFALCPDCAREYSDPLDRRFHAQPLACPTCGPRLTFRDGDASIEDTEAAIEACLGALRDGRIAAIKGVGGYHLVCDAQDEAAVTRLRARKRRPVKPLAVMFPMGGNDGLAAVRRQAMLTPGAARALLAPERSIVLVDKRADNTLAPSIAPRLAEFGAFLPYSPLHHVLLGRYGRPVVATSANLSGEPVLTDGDEVEARLGGVADVFLHHNRPIVRPADDAVVRLMGGAVRPVRLGRGTAPLEVELPMRLEQPVLALGGHMKATLALAWGGRAVVSPHIGDLDSVRAMDVFAQLAADFARLYGVAPQRLVCDAHPHYASHRWARAQALPVTTVLHHHAHASGLALERPDVRNWAMLTWDGVGYGADGTLWGGETLIGAPGRWRRVGSWRPFRLTGGDRVAREPWRSAAALLWKIGRSLSCAADPNGLAHAAWRNGVNTIESSAVGRLFDAAAALVLDAERVSFEGQGPMELEAVAQGAGEALALPQSFDASGVLRIDWTPLLDLLCEEGLPRGARAADFHATLAAAACAQIQELARIHPIDAVGLTGGVFQNRRLTENLIERLSAAGFEAIAPTLAPANDGGLALGQVVECAALAAAGAG